MFKRQCQVVKNIRVVYFILFPRFAVGGAAARTLDW